MWKNYGRNSRSEMKEIMENMHKELESMEIPELINMLKTEMIQPGMELRISKFS